MKTNETKATFKAGQMYYGRHICSSDTISRYRVERRTEKFVWVINVDHKGNPYKGETVLRRKIENWTNGETFLPSGRHSMALSISAANPFTVQADAFVVEFEAARAAEAAKTYAANAPAVLVVLPPLVISGPARCSGTTWSFVRMPRTCAPASWAFSMVRGQA